MNPHDPAGAQPPDTITPATRAYIRLVIVAIASFGLPLYLVPGAAPRYWAWTVADPRTAMLIGSVYFVSTIYYSLLYLQRDWLLIRMSLRSLFVVAAWLLVAAMFHWGAFYPYRGLTLVWLGSYYLPLFFLPILFRLQTEVFGTIEDPDGLRIAPVWQAWIRARGTAYAAAALALFALAPTLAESWPWPIEVVNVRMLSGQVAVFGAFAAFDLRDGSWRRMRFFMLITTMMGLAHVIALTLPFGNYDWTKPLAWPVMLMPVEWLLTSLGMQLTHRAR